MAGIFVFSAKRNAATTIPKDINCAYTIKGLVKVKTATSVKPTEAA